MIQRQRFAADPAHSKGRRHSESRPAHRNEFERDRDRVIHAAAFRRLQYKTQVFINHEGDWFRTRLTHSLEVAQIARSVARALGLHEDLTEAIALAHDLGHTPFGHAGQDALNDCMAPWGGFEHNAQSLRVVDYLENKYAAHPGLNLMFDTREGILKHCSDARASQLGDIGERFLQRTQPSLEAQLANAADELAYNNHDIDDGLRSGLLPIEALREVPLFARMHDVAMRECGRMPAETERQETIRRMIGAQVADLIQYSRQRIDAAGVDSADEVRVCGMTLISFSPPMSEQNLALKRLLRRALYEHPKVQRVMGKARRVVRDLFEALQAHPALLPLEAREPIRGLDNNGESGHARRVADYIASMTDRAAIAEHERLFDLRHLRLDH